MIRRAFWLALGAGLGITGYRRLDRLTRSIALGRRAPAALDRLAPGGRGTMPPRGFLSDVREGMAEYLNRQAGRSGNTLEGSRADRSPLVISDDNPKDGR